MKTKLLLLCLAFTFQPLNDALAVQQPNVILIICDDLNDYVEGFGGHPQTQTPNIARLSKAGVTFTQAHCNIPICGPSRASLVYWNLPPSLQLLWIYKMERVRSTEKFPNIDGPL